METIKDENGNIIMAHNKIGDATGGHGSSVIASVGNSKGGDCSSVRIWKGDAEGGYGSSVTAYKGNAIGGYDSSVRTYEGNATGGNNSSVRVEIGDAKGGCGSAVRTGEGKATCGDCSLAMGTSVVLGENSVGGILEEVGGVMKLVKVVVNGDVEIVKYEDYIKDNKQEMTLEEVCKELGRNIKIIK